MFEHIYLAEDLDVHPLEPGGLLDIAPEPVTPIAQRTIRRGVKCTAVRQLGNSYVPRCPRQVCCGGIRYAK